MDLVAIGTSPLMMLRALRFAEQGKKVMLIDRASEFGGSWLTSSVLGFENVEVGVHLLENRPALYTFIVDNLKVEMEPDLDRSFGLWHGKRIGIGLNRVLLHSLVSLKALKNGAFDRSRRLGISAVRASMSMHVPFYYPKGGCAEITQNLRHRLEASGALFLMGRSVEAIDLSARGAVRLKVDREVLTSSQVMVSSRAHAPVVIDGELQNPQLEPTRTLSAVLHLKEVESSFNYVEIIGDTAIRRVRDIGRYASPSPQPGHVLWCLQVRKYPPTTDTGSWLVDQLLRLGILPKTASLVGFARHELDLQTITDASLRQLHDRSFGRLVPVYSTDFAEGFLTFT